MSGRGTATRTEVCFISELYALLRLLKAPAKGVLVLQDVDARGKDERGSDYFTILFKETPPFGLYHREDDIFCRLFCLLSGWMRLPVRRFAFRNKDAACSSLSNLIILLVRCFILLCLIVVSRRDHQTIHLERVDRKRRSSGII